jgi:hypothetical protein
MAGLDQFLLYSHMIHVPDYGLKLYLKFYLPLHFFFSHFRDFGRFEQPFTLNQLFYPLYWPE